MRGVGGAESVAEEERVTKSVEVSSDGRVGCAGARGVASGSESGISDGGGDGCFAVGMDVEVEFLGFDGDLAGFLVGAVFSVATFFALPRGFDSGEGLLALSF